MAKNTTDYKVVGSNVVEKTTNQVIYKCPSRKEAIQLVSKLIEGTGFAGNTPRFFCIQVKVS